MFLSIILISYKKKGSV